MSRFCRSLKLGTGTPARIRSPVVSRDMTPAPSFRSLRSSHGFQERVRDRGGSVPLEELAKPRPPRRTGGGLLEGLRPVRPEPRHQFVRILEHDLLVGLHHVEMDRITVRRHREFDLAPEDEAPEWCRT